MSLTEKLQADMKEAMRAKDVLKRDTLRMAISALKNRAIDKGGELSESDELSVLEKAVKTRHDSATQYKDADRADLAEKELAEAELLQAYLPQKLGEDETKALVERLIAELGISSKKDIGQLMKRVMADHKGEVEGKLVQRFAGELLS